MKQNELLHAISTLSSSQRKQLEYWLIDKLSLNNDLASTKPKVCPYCKKETRMVKKGFENSKQRYECKECKHRFTYDSHTITMYSKLDKTVFYEIVSDTINLIPIAKTAARLDISVKTVFYNRHKFLAYIEDYLINDKDNILAGTIEIDETYYLESLKGCRDIKRKARHRGEPSNYRGLSHEQVAIVTTTDRNGHEIYKAVGYAKPTTKTIISNFENKFKANSIFYTDGTFIYDQLAKNSNCKIRQFKDRKEYNEVEHLNTVNYIHSFISRIFSHYRGVSTKYLNRYLSLFVLLRRFQDMDLNEKISLLIKDMKWYHHNINYRGIGNTNLSFINEVL